jgi:hypothetical protein
MAYDEIAAQCEREIRTLNERIELLERALVYSAHMQHATPQHMLPKGVALLDDDGVRVKLPTGEVIEASTRGVDLAREVER